MMKFVEDKNVLIRGDRIWALWYEERYDGLHELNYHMHGDQILHTTFKTFDEGLEQFRSVVNEIFPEKFRFTYFEEGFALAVDLFYVTAIESDRPDITFYTSSSSLTAYLSDDDYDQIIASLKERLKKSYA